MDSPEQIPLGRPNRKLRGHVAEIKMLHEAGHTISGIHQILTSKGIAVGRSAVFRELARMASAAPNAPPKVAPTAPEETPIETAAVNPQPELKPIEDVKKKVPTADEFFKSYNDNPLFRRKEKKP